MIRLATLHDIPKLKEMVVRFVLEEMPDPPEPDPDIIEDTLLMLIHQQDKNSMALVSDRGGEVTGFILGTTVPSSFSKHLYAVELGYYVLPEYRKSKDWKELIKTYEEWAKKIAGADYASVSLLDERVGKLYQRLGYKVTEVTYKKELK